MLQSRPVSSRPHPLFIVSLFGHGLGPVVSGPGRTTLIFKLLGYTRPPQRADYRWEVGAETNTRTETKPDTLRPSYGPARHRFQLYLPQQTSWQRFLSKSQTQLLNGKGLVDHQSRKKESDRVSFLAQEAEGQDQRTEGGTQRSAELQVVASARRKGKSKRRQERASRWLPGREPFQQVLEGGTVYSSQEYHTRQLHTCSGIQALSSFLTIALAGTSAANYSISAPSAERTSTWAKPKELVPSISTKQERSVVTGIEGRSHRDLLSLEPPELSSGHQSDFLTVRPKYTPHPALILSNDTRTQ
ncbi:hypothetical protein LZ30DRAFT_691015 [Colletotrichum cereale]|nr:hypothetical protein LZ30DRAFT_691015 [Colletotrichum cereale]